MGGVNGNKFKRLKTIVRRERAQQTVPKRRMLYGFILGIAVTWFIKPYIDRYMQRRAEPRLKHNQISIKNIPRDSSSNVLYDSLNSGKKTDN
jgi:hypothetical protein